MLTAQQKQELYNPNHYKGVGMQTRTDIIGALEIDIDTIIDEFTTEELCLGLRYIIQQNEKYHSYLGVGDINTDHKDISLLNPFSGDLWSSWGDADIVAMRGGIEPCCYFADMCSKSSGNANDDCGDCAPCLLTATCLSLIQCYFCCCWTMNTFNTVEKSKENNLVKRIKISTASVTFIPCFLLAWYFLPPVSCFPTTFQNDFIRNMLACSLGTSSPGILSYLSNKIACMKKDFLLSDKLLDALKTVHDFLDGKYFREGDDRKQCIAFTKQVIIYFVNSSVKKKSIVDRVLQYECKWLSGTQKKKTQSRASWSSSNGETTISAPKPSSSFFSKDLSEPSESAKLLDEVIVAQPKPSQQTHALVSYRSQ